jgi:hypothetical protein
MQGVTASAVSPFFFLWPACRSGFLRDSLLFFLNLPYFPLAICMWAVLASVLSLYLSCGCLDSLSRSTRTNMEVITPNSGRQPRAIRGSLPEAPWLSDVPLSLAHMGRAAGAASFLGLASRNIRALRNPQ